MKSPITKFAAAAVIAITIGLLAYHHMGSIDGTSVAFGIEQVIDAMKKVELVHFKSDLNASYRPWILEGWIRIKPRQDILILDQDRIEYDDPNQRMYYSIQNNTVTRQRRKPYPNPHSVDSVVEYFDGIISVLKKDGATVKYSMEDFRGKQVELISIKYQTAISEVQLYLFVDLNTKLPLRSGELQKGKNFKETRTWLDYDYPDSGPKDIYEAGVPRTAKIIDSD
jgi:hypothetical protein